MFYILTSPDETLGVFDSREAAITAHREAYTESHCSRYRRWYLIPYRLNDWRSPEHAEPFAWGETLITDDNREQILRDWA